MEIFFSARELLMIEIELNEEEKMNFYLLFWVCR
jgi:hypothetical protein